MLAIFVFTLTLFQDSSILSPTTTAIVTAIFTVVIGAVGIVYLKDKVNASSRIQGLIAGLLAAYGIITPVISNLPRSLGMVIAVIGLVVTLFSGRLQGPPSEL